MKRKIIHIDEERCNGCGLCVDACHEGAIALVDGKARLTSESYCDGLGDCLPQCPTGAIAIVEKESAPYTGPAPEKNEKPASPPVCACPGTRPQHIRSRSDEPAGRENERPSHLAQWPCQIKLMPVRAPYLDGSRLLIAADCAAYANANVHNQFMKGKITLIGCPKLDGVDYSEKLTEILKSNDIRSITVLRMSVPCCGGLTAAVKKALMNSGKMIPWNVVTLSVRGEIMED